MRMEASTKDNWKMVKDRGSESILLLKVIHLQVLGKMGQWRGQDITTLPTDKVMRDRYREESNRAMVHISTKTVIFTKECGKMI